MKCQQKIKLKNTPADESVPQYYSEPSVTNLSDQAKTLEVMNQMKSFLTTRREDMQEEIMIPLIQCVLAMLQKMLKLTCILISPNGKVDKLFCSQKYLITNIVYDEDP